MVFAPFVGLLLRAHEPLVWVLAAALAIGSKFAIQAGGKHVLNPACCGIVGALLVSGRAWVSPAIWGAPAWFALLAACLGALVLSRAGRAGTALAFLGTYGALLVARCLVLGDPLAIPLHQMQSGSLLVFAAFMVTDPRSTPDDRAARLGFAAAVAVIAYWLQFHWQVREGLFYALALAAPLTVLLDRWRPAPRFRWTGLKEA